MTAADRRRVLRLAGLAALVAAGGPALALGSGFRPPATPLRYTRRIARELSGGYALTATRSFAVSFVPQGSGYLLTGEQVSVEVAAPETIAALAEIERRRVETGLFPIRLDGAGLIAGGPELHPAAELDRAIAEAERLLASRAPAGRDDAAAETFVRMVHRVGAGLGARLPRDLFAPLEERRVEHRAIALPDAGSGEVEVVFTAETDPGTGLMRAAQRAIVTSVEGDSRTTREDWTLRAI